MENCFSSRPRFTWLSFLLFLALSLVLLGVIAYGSTVLVEASHKTRTSQISLLRDQIELWNESRSDFMGMTVWLTAQNSSAVWMKPDENDDFHFKGVKLPTYPHYKYYANETLVTQDTVLKQVQSVAAVSTTQPEIFNLTTNLLLTYFKANQSKSEQIFRDVVVFQKTAVPLNQKSTV